MSRERVRVSLISDFDRVHRLLNPSDSPRADEDTERKGDSLIVAALPTKLLTTVGLNPTPNPRRPNTLIVHFSAFGFGPGLPSTKFDAVPDWGGKRLENIE
jgi:hypothetical protein